MSVPEPVVDAASLLAKLSSISGGNLANLASASTTSTPLSPPQQQQDKDNALPPALARLLGGIVSTPPAPQAPTVPIPTPTNTGVINNAGLPAQPVPPQPPMATTNDPRLRQFPQQSPPRSMMDPRVQSNNNNVQQPRTRPSRWNTDDSRPMRHEQLPPPPTSMPPSRDMMGHPPPPPLPPAHPEQHLPGPVYDPSLQPGTIRGIFLHESYMSMSY